MNSLLVQYVIVAEPVDDDIEHGIRTTASKVAEGLLIDPSRKWRMEEINETQYDTSVIPLHVLNK